MKMSEKMLNIFDSDETTESKVLKLNELFKENNIMNWDLSVEKNKIIVLYTFSGDTFVRDEKIALYIKELIGGTHTATDSSHGKDEKHIYSKVVYEAIGQEKKAENASSNNE